MCLQLSCWRRCSLPVVQQGLVAAGEAAHTALRMFQLPLCLSLLLNTAPRALRYCALPTAASSALRHTKCCPRGSLYDVLLTAHLAPDFRPPEYCPRGSLYDVLSTARRDPAAARHLTWARRLHLVGSMFCGVGLEVLTAECTWRMAAACHTVLKTVRHSL